MRKILLLITLPFLMGCYTQKKASRQANKAFNRFPVLAPKASTGETITKFIKGEEVINTIVDTVKKDSLIYVYKTKLVYRTDTVNLRRVDTVLNQVAVDEKIREINKLKTIIIEKDLKQERLKLYRNVLFTIIGISLVGFIIKKYFKL